jgi:hypothetical protein
MNGLQAENIGLDSGTETDTKQFNTFKALENESSMVGLAVGLLSLFGNRLLALLQALAQALFGQTIDEQAEDHNETERDQATRLFHKYRGGEKQGIFEETKTPFRAALP